MGKFVGIDLGTTYSVVAHINAQGKAEVIPNGYGRNVTPSVIYFGGATPVVGDEARDKQELGEADIAAFFKRDMGNAQYLRSFHDQDYTAIDLSALILQNMKEQAENFLGEPVTDAVITVPAYFDHNQRTATLEAGRKAGLNVLKIISEPTAAALAYGLRPGRQAQNQTVLVYDLGGGTFDISLVSITPSDVIVIGTDGDHYLGGKDWDDRLIEHLAVCFEQESGVTLTDEEMDRLRVQAEKLKRSLSVKPSVEFHLQAGGSTGTFVITRTQFENLTRDLLERTQTLSAQVLQDAGKDWSELNGVLPVGGSTKMPMVIHYIEQISGKAPMSGIHPEEAVALGAAIQAAMELEERETPAFSQYRLAGRKSVMDVISHSLGLIAENSDRTSYLNSIIIRKNLAIPSTQIRPYQMKVRRGRNTELEVYLTQSESSDPQQCVYLGRYVFSDFPPIQGRIAVLDISYIYDKNGVVHVAAVERSTGKLLKLESHPVPPDVPARFARRPTENDKREHLTIYLAFDVSGSMYVKQKKVEPLKEAKSAAEKFVSQCDLSTTSVGLIAFSDRVHVEQVATQNINEIMQAIQKLPIVNTGSGNEADPFDTIDELLDARVIDAGPCFAVVLADGRWFHQYVAIQKAQHCRERGIEIIAVGFGGADRKFLDSIASTPEQSFFTDLSKLGETFSTIAQVLTETGGELRLGRSVS